MHRDKVRRRPGFTLIELLIVVGIIAILAAIAVGNMLEAQTRAKVARVKNDMRVIATALESYAVDSNHYPPNYNSGAYSINPISEYLSYAALTTPISYITSAPTDIFRPDPAAIAVGLYFDYVNLDSIVALPTKYGIPMRTFWEGSGTQWCISSLGPDIFNDGITRHLDATANYTYDATNGTRSAGDLFRTNRAS